VHLAAAVAEDEAVAARRSFLAGRAARAVGGDPCRPFCVGARRRSAVFSTPGVIVSAVVMLRLAAAGVEMFGTTARGFAVPARAHVPRL
jgi:hypothetical protein